MHIHNYITILVLSKYNFSRNLYTQCITKIVYLVYRLYILYYE